jgi:hypothetical protein
MNNAKVTNMQLNEIINMLGDCKKAITLPSVVIDGRLSYALSRNITSFSVAQKTFHQQRFKILKKYVKIDKVGNVEFDAEGEPFWLNDDSKPKFTEETIALLSKNTTVNFYQFNDVETRSSNCVGEESTLSLLWAVTDEINSLVKSK